MKTKKQVLDFLESKIGTKVPCKGDKSLDGQCVTLIKALMEFIGAPDPYKKRGHAKTCISAYLNEGIADKGIGFLSVFSNKNMGGGYGHVWCNAGDGDGTYYESNGAKKLTVTKGKTYTYDAVCNFDKYIKDDNMNDNDYGDMVYKSSQYDNVVYKIVDKNANPRQIEYTVIVDKYNKVVSESKSKDEDVKECRLEKNALSEEKKRLEQDNEQLAAENLQLKTKVTSLETASKHAQAQLDNTKKVVQEQSTAIDELEQKLRVEKENHKATHNNYVKCKDTNIELERRVTKLENELSDPSIAELVSAILRKIKKGMLESELSDLGITELVSAILKKLKKGLKQ